MGKISVKKYLDSSWVLLSDRADRDIEKYRKADFKIKITAPDGTAVSGATVHAKHHMHDFDFGCNIFMLNQYDTPKENSRYETEWKKLFNTAVVPLYWEGTEPRQGELRYDADAPNDVYRRPSAGSVTEFCQKNGLRMKGHPLFWHEFIPEWLPENFSELKPLIDKRFHEISERFGDIIPVFDCVNEPARIWDVHREHPCDGWKHIVPEKNYCKWIFDLAQKYFPQSQLILNEAVGASFTEFHGRYGAYYLNIKDLLGQGVAIDRIGLQCHTYDSPLFRNIYDISRFYDILDTYAEFGKPLVLSEISVPSSFGDDGTFQAQAVEMLYRVCFSHPAMSGVFWWNLADDGILCTKRRAEGENLPSTGLLDGEYHEKPAYRTLDRLINREWRTDYTGKTDQNGCVSFRGFTGEYILTVDGKETAISLTAKTPETIITNL